ncbi:SepL/TyeA/HrpJ family type III secretion system gatekeeper [Deltaproteobacteria bacterium Smac51]|nr:SepL/TyeA/HrpJ family type III secretion system gatekeeper [Deltaproteobacteria bacterium Smac51]
MSNGLTIHNQPIQTGGPQEARGAAPSTAHGTLAGHRVSTVQNPMSLLANSAEELAFAVDNSRETKLAQRKEKAGRPDTGRFVDRVRMFQELMEKNGRLDKAADLKGSLRNSRDAGAALNAAKESFPDAAEAFAVLSQIREELEGEGDAETLKVLDEALALLEKEDGPRIRAAINGAAQAEGFEPLGGAMELGQGYRQVACDFSGAAEMFEFIHQTYGTDGFDLALDFLYRALAADLAADVPGMGGGHLESVAANLGLVRNLQSAYALVDRLTGRWKELHKVKSSRLTAMGLFKEIMSFKDERFIAAARVSKLAQMAEPPDVEMEVIFLQEFLGAARNFTNHFFQTPDNRVKFIDAVQEAVDEAIAREDEFLASLEE